MKQVYIILEVKQEDYHGTYTDIIAVYKNRKECQNKIKQLGDKNGDYNIEYIYEVFNLI